MSQNQELAGERSGAFTLLSVAGSLWFAGLLLMLLLVGMASATIYESTFGTERALATFYTAWWFKALLALTGLNIAASLALRVPFTRRQLGFVLTHGGLLAIMAGAAITIGWGVDGQLAVVEGQSEDTLRVRTDQLELVQRSDRSSARLLLSGGGFGGFEIVEHPHAGTLTLGDLALTVVRYLPDSTAAERIVDDNPRRQPAVEVSLGGIGAPSDWVFADQPTPLGATTVLYRVADSAEALAALLAPRAADSTSPGTLRLEIAGATYEVPVETCTAAPAPIGETGRTVRVLRYLPHATVGEGNQLVNVSPQPVNPTVEIELAGPQGAERRICFAKFPDFQGMHGETAQSDVTARFAANPAAGSAAPIEIIGAPDGRLFVRFAAERDAGEPAELIMEKPIESPWPGQALTVYRRYEHARIDSQLAPVQPVREPRIPAVLVKLTSGGESTEMWVQRGAPRPVSVHGVPYEIHYSDRTVPLGFTVRLDDFRVVHYPGGRQPRSFESDITITDAATGASQQRRISMNHPVSYGGFTLYQSSYNEAAAAATSIFSVARDPGQFWVFTGYVLTFLGMIVVLNNRLRERRALAAQALAAGKR